MRTSGHLWQGRYGSVAMDEDHLISALRYVALNPVRARLAARAQDWRWSSTVAHLAGRSDGVVTVEPALDRVGDFAAFLDQNFDEAEAYGPLRKAELIGRPVGTAAWIAGMEARTGMALAPGKRGPKPKRDQIV